jgi:hypothetical protein
MPDTSLYSRLKKLFSSNVIVRKTGGRKLRVIDTDSIQAFTSNAMRDRYSRIHAAGGYAAPFSTIYGQNMAYQTQRIMLFRDYDQMDTDPILGSALDVYGEESTLKNEYSEVLTINTDNSEIKDILHNLFYDILNIEFTLFTWVRNMCKYGDFFLFLEISPDYGIHNVLPLSVYDTTRIEGENPDNPYYVYFETLGANGYKQKFENYEIAHFRLMADANFLPYGKSVIESARRIYRQLVLLEDAMMIHRIMRAPEKRVFKVDIGNIPPAEVDTYMERLMSRSKKVPFMDPQTGEYNQRYNMQNILEDFWIPIRGNDSVTSIENLGGLEYNGIEDVQYLLSKMMACLKIPKAYFGYDETVADKVSLAAQDLRFARSIERIQRIIVSELTKIAIIHLYSQGYTDEELVNFTLHLTPPSTIYEQEKINLWTQKVALISQMQGTNMMSTNWMYNQLFDLPEDEIEHMREEIVEDKKRMFRLQQIEQGASDPARFGYPQEQKPEENPIMQQRQPSNSVQPGTPSDNATHAIDMPKSLDDLPTEDELKLGEDNRGRPKKGIVYGQDNHPLGRDPLGFKGRFKSVHFGKEREPSKKSKLSLEYLDQFPKAKRKLNIDNKILTESSTKPHFLDESNLLSEKHEN